MSKVETATKGFGLGLILVVVVIICGAFLGFKGLEGGQPEPTPSVDYEIQFDFPDCDADDRSPNWEVKDCGPSPTPGARKTPGTKKTPGPATTRKRR